MKRGLTLIGKILLRIIVISLVITAVIYGVRFYNDMKYKPKDFDASAQKAVTDLSQYNQNIPGVQVKHIEGNYMNGFHLIPKVKKHKGVVITFGGSEGSPAYYAAEPLAKQGYEVISLFFFGMKNQKDELVEVPLEFFQEVLDYTKAHVKDSDDLTLIGTSKGAELCLNLATLYPKVDHVVLYAPSAWNNMGLPKQFSQNMTSSWSYQGKALPFIDTTKSTPSVGMNLMLDYMLKRPIDFRPGYEQATTKAKNVEATRIKVEKSKADLLIFAGDQDKMWQSEVSAREIQKHRPDKTEVHVFKGAGHLYFGNGYLYTGPTILELGGTTKANEKANIESSKIINERLAQWHPQP
ncbi:alpha/beta fold hydrolase [Vaginisenegalia massiliensis]|uniref:alpha/beta fold hydrolase n=1 Tax=Vaginisenegalia massiliensis TaxID=2058294 RepID=UPI000F5209ED|nr:alpha/beta fold hydrolase [Vaginisenegalia massiliensis]